MPSSMNSLTTLLTEAVLRPVAQLRSCLLHGCPMNSDHSRTERLSLRKSRTVDRLRSATVPSPPVFFFFFLEQVRSVTGFRERRFRQGLARSSVRGKYLS